MRRVVQVLANEVHLENGESSKKLQRCLINCVLFAFAYNVTGLGSSAPKRSGVKVTFLS